MKEIVRRLGEALAHGRRVDRCIGEHISDMNTKRSKFPSDGFGEDALRGLVGAKPAKLGFSAIEIHRERSGLSSLQTGHKVASR
jgi:hypothetical protein